MAGSKPTSNERALNESFLGVEKLRPQQDESKGLIGIESLKPQPQPEPRISSTPSSPANQSTPAPAGQPKPKQ